MDGNCMVCPMKFDDLSGEFGVFAVSEIKEKDLLWVNGPFHLDHDDLCVQINVEPQEEAVPFAKRRKAATKKFVPVQRPRHLHSYLQNMKDFTDEKDFGSLKNVKEGLKWCDLSLHRSPTMFVNSVTPTDGRQPNIIFEVESDGNGERSIVTATRDIHPGEEILGDYMLNVKDAKKKKTKNKRKRAISDVANTDHKNAGTTKRVHFSTK